MLRSSGEETEILLGNKQLLGIFFVVAVLLGIAFTGGYMVGRGSSDKKAGEGAVDQSPAAKSGSNASTAGETHSIPAEPGSAPDQTAGPNPGTKTPGEHSGHQAESAAGPRNKSGQQPEPARASRTFDANFAPERGQEFLQVAAVSKDEAEAVADVLYKKGFRAHAVPKPGNGAIYRVLIGPIRDAGDLSSTRDALRRTGFREVIVQHY